MTIETPTTSKAPIDFLDQAPVEQPPPYVRSAPGPIAGPSQARAEAIDGVQAGNFVLISKVHDAVKGTFVVDPTLEVPDHALPPLESASARSCFSSILSPNGEAKEVIRPNLSLESTHGRVTADVHVIVGLPPPANKRPLRTLVKARSSYSGVTLKVHRDDSTPSAVQIDVSASHGSIVVSLPRNFQGPFKISSQYGSIKRSPSILSAGRLFYEKDHTQHGFIGDQTAWDADPGSWSGDEIVVKGQHASVTVRFSDEPEDPDEWTQLVQGVKGFVGRMFGAGAGDQ